METRELPRPMESNKFEGTRGAQRAKKRGTKSFATLIAGGGAGLVEGLACHPLDTIKVKMQLGQEVPQGVRVGVLQTGYQIVRHESFLAFYRGLGPVLFGIAPKMGVRFTSFEAYKALLSDSKSGQLSDERLLVSALAAGVTEAVVIVTPMDVIKIRLQAQKPGESGDTLLKSRTIDLFYAFKREGFRSIYSGMGLTALRQGTNQAANLFTYTKLMKALRGRQLEYQDSRLPMYQVSFIGLLAGSVGPLFNAPIDTLKTRIQQGPRVPGKSRTAQIFEITSTILQNDGVMGLYKGVLPRIMRVGIGQAVTFPVYEFLSHKFATRGY